MVGTIIFKNFETGSYKEMRICAFDGNTYSHIGKGDFIQCYINLEKETIRYDTPPVSNSFCPTMGQMFSVAKEGRRFLLANSHITVCEYTLNGENISIRPVSSNWGVYEVPEITSLFNEGGFYKLTKEFPEKPPLWLSCLCEVMNFCVQRVFSLSETVFSRSSYGIYINLSVFSKRQLKALGYGKNSPYTKIISAKNRCKICLKKPQSLNLNSTRKVYPSSKGKFIYELSLFKIKGANYFSDFVAKSSSLSDRLNCIMSLALDSFIEKITDDFFDLVLQYSRDLFEFGYLKSQIHTKMITLKEVMLLAFDNTEKGEVSKRVQARSKNFKLLNKLPCAKYFNSDGYAYWE